MIQILQLGAITGFCLVGETWMDPRVLFIHNLKFDLLVGALSLLNHGLISH